MASIFDTEVKRTPITYDSCARLGMRYIDTLNPQYRLSVKRKVHTSQGEIVVFDDYVHVIFRLNTDRPGMVVSVYYKLDQNEEMVEMCEPCEELLSMVVAEVNHRYAGK